MAREDVRPGLRLRLARAARGVTQEQLARAAGVTRQAIAGMESGKWEPSLRVALALARALDTTVEELFDPTPTDTPVEAAVVATAGATSRLALAEVAGRTVAFGLGRDGDLQAGFGRAAAVVHHGEAVHPGATVVAGALAARGSVLAVAGCDPALALLGPALARLPSPVELLWWPCGSTTSLQLLAQGAVHVAGVHHGPDSDGAAQQVSEALGPGGGEVIRFAQWREGLLSSPHQPGVPDLAEVARRRVALANREVGSEARAVLERERLGLGLEPEELVGYHSQVRGHLAVASAIASGLAGAGIASEPAALAYGLRFVPLTAERYDLVVPRSELRHPAVEGLLTVLGSPWMRSQLAALDGYDAGHLGEVVGDW